MIRILFVEDDPIVTSNFRRMLSGARREWELHFASSAAEALTTLDLRPYDVVVTSDVSDSKGNELLAQVRYRHPRVIRVLLVEVDEGAGIARSANVAHGILRKPCDPNELAVFAERACQLERRLADPDLQAVVAGIGVLPSPSGMIMELNDVINRYDATASDVAGVIETDAAITAKLLQLVNSAYFSLSHQVFEVREAVAYLGMDVVRDLGVAMEMLQCFESAPVLVQSAVDELHQHSLTVACVARELMTDRVKANEAFVAALLHDVGLMVIANQAPEKFVQLRVQTMRSNLDLVEVELEVVGAHHADIGASLLDLWGLPYPIVEAVARHHDAQAIPFTTIDPVHAVHIADAIVSCQLQPGGSGWEDGGVLDEAYLERLGVVEQVYRIAAGS